jgi:hypothetical protein
MHQSAKWPRAQACEEWAEETARDCCTRARMPEMQLTMARGMLWGLQMGAALAAANSEWLQAAAHDLREAGVELLADYGEPTSMGILGKSYWNRATQVIERAAQLEGWSEN